MRIYVGPPVLSKEFCDFDMGITFYDFPFIRKKWFVFSDEGVFLQNCTCERKSRKWTPPADLQDLLFEVSNVKIAVLYGQELRMRKLLKRLSEFKIDLVLGYIKMNRYGSHLLLANGWGASQVSGVPTLLVSHMNSDRAAYSLFKKEERLNDGIEFLYERYLFFELPYSQEKSGRKDPKWNNGIKGDK